MLPAQFRESRPIMVFSFWLVYCDQEGALACVSAGAAFSSRLVRTCMLSSLCNHSPLGGLA